MYIENDDHPATGRDKAGEAFLNPNEGKTSVQYTLTDRIQVGRIIH